MTALFDFSTFPILESERLILREIVETDADAVFAIRGDYEVTKYNSGAAYVSRDQARNLIAGIRLDYEAGESIRWGITVKGDDTLVGMCGFNYWNRQDHRASIGYDLLRKRWGQGIMPETLRVILEFGFRHMNLNRIEADTSLHNLASVRVLEKLGFRQEGRQREQYFEDGQFHDLLLFALLKRDYETQKDEKA